VVVVAAYRVERVGCDIRTRSDPVAVHFTDKPNDARAAYSYACNTCLVIAVSYILLLIIAINSAIGIISVKSREKLYRWNIKLLYPALFLLAAGIFIGAVWANISWGRYWGWDAKETWALITMLVYAVPLHRKSLPSFSDPLKFHRYCLIAFLTVLMTFLGVSFLLGGIHSYL